MVEFQYEASTLGLINVDMQSVFVHGTPISAPNGLLVLEKVNQITAQCRSNGATVIHTRHVIRPNGSNVGVMGELMPNVFDGFMNSDQERTQLYPELDVEASDIVLDKPRFGAFTHTDLDLILRSKGIDTVAVTGIATNICCETTAREAYALNYKVLFIEDATCTFDMEGSTAGDLQKATCSSLAFGFSEVVTTEQFCRELNRSI
ncbi:MAG: cysteine hydrolase [Rhodospirillaceae bacterium]|nr:cysteine hydrolase [Rhodospirillaceae bacterium]